MFADQLLIDGLQARQDEHAEPGEPLHTSLELPQDDMADADRLPRDPLAANQELTLDAIQGYLNEIGRVALLNAVEEVELAERLARGHAAARRLAEGESLPPQLRAALQAEVVQGQAAHHHLTQANLRLVVSIAKKYAGRGLSLMDLIQEGNIGLMRAVEKFDPTRGNRFSTYATWWIRQAVTRALAEQSRTIRLPVHMSESIGQLKRTVNQLSQTLGRQPTREELALALGQTVEKITRLLEALRQPISLETPVGENQENTLGEFIEDHGHEAPAEVATQHLLRRDVLAVLDELTERERKILLLRYGLLDGQHRTLEQVGKVIGMTRERARQIESEALRKLRTSEIGRHLQDYLA
jgi:RNA polymerase primary sigma factor